MNMVFYEIEHGIGSNHFLYERNTNHSFPLHMHRCYEMVLMLEGEMRIKVDTEEYEMRAGDLLLIKPYRIHSYETDADKSSLLLLCVFSDDLIAAVSASLSGYRLRTVHLHDIPKLYQDVFIHMQGKTDLPSVKGFLYMLCSLFCQEIDYDTEDTFSGSTRLLRDIFVYIENNIADTCSLRKLAKELRYNESYLSRIFLSSVGIPYSEYVRNLKINHACQLLRNTDESIFSIASQCGYTTHSSFNRAFKQITGVTPQEYRSPNGAKPVARDK